MFWMIKYFTFAWKHFRFVPKHFRYFFVKHFIYYTRTLENFERLRTLHNILNDQKQSRNVRNILECFETFKLVWEHLRVFAWKSTQINSVKRFIMFWMIKKIFQVCLETFHYVSKNFRYVCKIFQICLEKHFRIVLEH